MNYKEEIEEVDRLIAGLRTLKSDLKKAERKSEKAFSMNIQDHSPRQMGKASTDLNWQCMEVDKSKTRVARLFDGSCCDVGRGQKDYNPSAFHQYHS